MADKLTIRYWDDPVLSTVCDAVEDNEFGPKLEEFGESLLATMDAHNGIGLAGPQVGVAKRVFVMTFPDGEIQWEGKQPVIVNERAAVVVCNPTLVLDGGTVREREGCLSLPGIHEQVARAEKVTMQFRYPNGVAEELILTNINARVAQHEFDHCNGLMFFDFRDKRPQYGSRMSKQTSKYVLRLWEKEKTRRGL